MKFLDNLSKKLNPTQKIIVGVFVPLILLVITIAITSEVGYSYSDEIAAFDWENTWAIWVIFLAVVGYFEYKLFSQTDTTK